jgi:hypothetical protein
MKRRSLFQMLMGLFVAPKLPAAPVVPGGFVFCPDYRMPRYHWIAGQWVKAGLTPLQAVNPEYLAAPYEDRAYLPIITELPASSNSPNSPAASPASRPQI